MTDHPQNAENLRLLYEQTVKVAEAFWEWRYKTMTFSMTAITLLGAGWAWLWVNHPGQLVAAPLLLGALFSAQCVLLELRNRSIIRECYRVGKDLELALGAPGGAIFAAMPSSAPKGITYSKTLAAVFITITTVFLAGGIYYLAWPPH